MSAYEQVTNTIKEMRVLEEASGCHVNTMVDLVIPNITKVSGYRLAKLKRMLSRYDVRTNRWKL